MLGKRGIAVQIGEFKRNDGTMAKTEKWAYEIQCRETDGCEVACSDYDSQIVLSPYGVINTPSSMNMTTTAI